MTIVGVMPKGFAFPVNHHFWVPLRVGLAPPEPLDGAGPHGVRAARARRDARERAGRTGSRRPARGPGVSQDLRALQPQVMPYPTLSLASTEAADVAGLLAMQGIVVSLLVLVCLNVAILVYTRTAMRQAEIGLRTALGASRGRIVAQLFIEALVLSAVAAVAGVGIAAFALRQSAAATLPLASELPFWLSFRLSPGAVLYAGGAQRARGGDRGHRARAPGDQTQVTDRLPGCRGGGAGMRLGKTWTVLIVAQVGFAVALLPPAVSSAWEDARTGMAGPRIRGGRVSLRAARDGLGPGTAKRRPAARRVQPPLRRRQTELMRRLEAEPRVSGVTFAMANPGDERAADRAEAAPVESGAKRAALRSETEVREVRFNRVDVNFFRTFEVPILAGRGFEPADIGAVRPRWDRPKAERSWSTSPLAQQDFRRQRPRPAHPLCHGAGARRRKARSPGTGTRSSASSAISPPA